MSSKRLSDEPMQSGGKRPRLESENEASNDIEENVASNDIEENEASNDIEENVASNDIEVNEASNDIEENVASNDIEENEASNDIEENVASNDIEVNEASNNIEVNEASNDIEETEAVPIKIEYYPPEQIFCNEYLQAGETRVNKPEGMAGSYNIDLAISFSLCRTNHTHIDDDNSYLRNAGVLQLYKKDGRTKYTIPGKERVEYTAVSDSIYWENNIRTTHGHSERMLMRDMLDDLIEADSGKPGVPPRPSDYKDDTNTHHHYKVLNNLKEKASEYKRYLESKGLIVKMWSERQACDRWYRKGGACSKFIEDICPKGSQYGYIVKMKSSKTSPNDEIEVVKEGFMKLSEAFKKHSENR